MEPVYGYGAEHGASEPDAMDEISNNDSWTVIASYFDKHGLVMFTFVLRI